MRRSAFALLSWAILTCALPAGGAEPDDTGTVLTSQGVAVTIDAVRGSVLSLAVGGRGFLAKPGPAFLVRLTDPGDGTSRWVDSGAARSVQVAADPAEPGRMLVSYTAIADGLDGVVEWRRAAEGIAASLRIANRSGLILEQVYFPRFLLRTPVGDDAADDCLFMPGGDGFVAHHEGFADGRWLGRTYPGSASMQFMACYDSDGGLTLQCRDPEARPKTFVAQNRPEEGGVGFEVRHDLPFVPDEDVETAPILLAATGSSWTDAAASYREWARRQWWAAPKTGDDAPPDWLRQGFVTLGGSLRPIGAGKFVVKPDEWPEMVRVWRQATGAPAAMLDLREWEHDGVYTSPFYFPVYPSPEELTRLWRAVGQENARGMAMVAGLKWMIQRDAFPGEDYHITAFNGRKRFETEGRPVCVVGRDGRVMIDEPVFNWDGRHAYMCPAEPFTQQHFRNTARQLARVGFALFEFDQMNGGTCAPCYSIDHGHPPGPGVWMREAMARFIADTRRIGRQIDPEFATSIEDPSEVLLPQLDSFIGRADNLGEWPAAGPGTEVVPAFSFVYGPLVRSLAIDIQNSTAPHPFELLQTARAFIAGEVPSTNMAWWDMWWDYGKAGGTMVPTPDRMDADQLRLLSACVRMHCGAALPYMSFGEMLAAEPTGLPERGWKHVAWEDGKRVEDELMSPPVLVSAWRAADGGVAFVFVNMASEPVTFPYGFGAGGPGRAADALVRVAVNGEFGRETTLEQLGDVHVEGLSTLLVEFPEHGR